MTDEEIQQFLIDNGYPDHVVRGGSPGLIRRWRAFVGEVEKGYEYGLEDYRNDLDIRGVISLLGLDEQVAEEDERLDALLTHREVRVWESTSEAAPWDFGFPRNAAGDLLADLKREGLAG